MVKLKMDNVDPDLCSYLLPMNSQKLQACREAEQIPFSVNNLYYIYTGLPNYTGQNDFNIKNKFITSFILQIVCWFTYLLIIFITLMIIKKLSIVGFVISLLLLIGLIILFSYILYDNFKNLHLDQIINNIKDITKNTFNSILESTGTVYYDHTCYTGFNQAAAIGINSFCYSAGYTGIDSCYIHS